MAIPDTMIEEFLTFWYPGEWPDNLGLPGGRMADEAFKEKARKECREGLEAAGVGELAHQLSCLRDQIAGDLYETGQTEADIREHLGSTNAILSKIGVAP